MSLIAHTNKGTAGAGVKKMNEIKVGRFSVTISNFQKIYWPDEGFTKGDVINYYDKMANIFFPI